MAVFLHDSLRHSLLLSFLLWMSGRCHPRPELPLNTQLQIQDVRATVVYNGDTDYFLMDVANYRPDTASVITLRSLTAGNSDTYTIDQIWIETTTRLRVWINQRWPMMPGSYSITLTQSDGRMATTSQRLEVKPGVARLDGFTRVSPGLAGQPVTVPGKNLFGGRQASLLLKNAFGQTWSLSAEETAADGSTLRLTLPANLQPGYYSLALSSSASPGFDCQRFSVLRTEGQPYLLGLDDKADPYNRLAQAFCPDTASLSFTRSETSNYDAWHTLTFGTNFFTNVSTFTAQVQFTNITTQQTYRLAFQMLDDYYGSWYDLHIQTKWFEGRYSVSHSLPVGRYRVALAYTDKLTGQTSVSEPYERIIQVN